ncbi:hypothetical protein CTI12_AA337300 [Artemisia annua]|uniref:DUF7733 domain-containing protein n=1 Tax=Artemisia annua TaxID=35608 RepID=A0A2U1MVF8_ARTAN|nr:hypothetical protein CTI12_AA337300 [Artemisia annua]
MSGISLAVETRPDSNPKTQNQTPVEDVIHSLRVIDLQLAAFITVFSASGLVPLFDLVFPAVTSAYLLFLSQLVFPVHVGHVGPTSTKKTLFQPSRLFRVYMFMGTFVGLVLPLAYVLGGFVKGDETAIRSVAPHLFLLSFQVLTENVVSGLGLFSSPVRVFVPMLYTVRRIFVMLDWIHDVWIDKTMPPNAEIK